MADDDNGQYGPKGSKILFENDLVRIWEVAVEPGGKQPLHHHEWPYVVMTVEGAKNQITGVDGQVKDTEEYPGFWVYSEPGHIHELHNVGATRYVNRLVEIKVSRPVELYGKVHDSRGAR